MRIFLKLKRNHDEITKKKISFESYFIDGQWAGTRFWTGQMTWFSLSEPPKWVRDPSGVGLRSMELSFRIVS